VLRKVIQFYFLRMSELYQMKCIQLIFFLPSPYPPYPSLSLYSVLLVSNKSGSASRSSLFSSYLSSDLADTPRRVAVLLLICPTSGMATSTGFEVINTAAVSSL
jgi:hypothetical protein